MSQMTMDEAVPQACQACGATDQQLIGISQWNASPANPGPVLDYYCLDIHACYDRVDAAAGLPL